MKNIQLVMEDDLYFKFVELKAKHQCSTWEELVQKMVDEGVKEKP